MSVRRLTSITSIPPEITKAFRNAEEPKRPEEVLWREVAARMTLDALSYTGATGEPDKHDVAVREARRWFRGIPTLENPHSVFDFALLAPYFESVRQAVLSRPGVYLRDDYEDYEDDDAGSSTGIRPDRFSEDR